MIENLGDSDCRISGRPTVIPLDIDGAALPLEAIVSLEMRRPNFVVVGPGQTAYAAVGWNMMPPASEAGGDVPVQWGNPSDVNA